MTCNPYVVDPTVDSCCSDWPLDLAIQERAVALAWSAMRYLSAGRLGYCEVTVRPCVARCVPSGVGVTGLWPVLDGGVWLNSCGCAMPQECSCQPLSEVRLSGEVAQIASVSIDGQLFLSWRLYDHRVLVRTDGEPWPTCQDLTAGTDKPDTFAVSYLPGVEPGVAGLAAVGTLACEFAKACTGSAKCRLPSSVTSVARQGVSMTFAEGLFPNGLTGIREVDAYILTVNPNALKVPPKVWSPDLAAHRMAERP